MADGHLPQVLPSYLAAKAIIFQEGQKARVISRIMNALGAWKPGDQGAAA